MDSRLKKYCNLNRIFLDNVSNIQECLLESNKTQQTLIELVELKSEFDTKFNSINRQYELFFAEKRVSIKNALDKNSVKNVTKEVVDDRVIHLFKDEYLKLKEEYDEAKLNSDLCLDLRMVMFQRKDLLCHMIEYLKTQCDRESCVINSTKFIEAIIGRQK